MVKRNVKANCDNNLNPEGVLFSCGRNAITNVFAC
jgi:hypothetical protein